MFLLLSFLQVMTGVFAMKESGIVVTNKPLSLLTKFCFLSSHGTLNYNFSFETSFYNYHLNIYKKTLWSQDSEEEAFLKECNGKENLQIPETEKVKLNAGSSGCEIIINEISSRNARCSGSLTVSVNKESCMLVSIGNCNTAKPSQFKYDVEITNDFPPNNFQRHFSSEHYYLVKILLISSIIYFTIFLITFIFGFQLIRRRTLHTTYKLFLTSVIFHMFGIILTSIYFVKYSLNGVGVVQMKLHGKIFRVISDGLFIFLLIHTAKSLSTAKPASRLISTSKVLIFTFAYIFGQTLLFVSEEIFGDFSSMSVWISLYFLIPLRFLGLLMFLLAVYYSISQNPGKLEIYIIFCIIFSAYFIIGPSVKFFSYQFGDNWMIEKVTFSADLLPVIPAHIAFLCYLRPSSATHHNFVFHNQTSRVANLKSKSASFSQMSFSKKFSRYKVENFSRVMHVFSVENNLKTGVGQQETIVNTFDYHFHLPNEPLEIYNPNDGELTHSLDLKF